MITYCTQHKETNPGLFCFIQNDGTHVDPRSCTCHSMKVDGERTRWVPLKADRSLADFPHLFKEYFIPTIESLRKQHVNWSNAQCETEQLKLARNRTIKPTDYVAEMKKKYGKANPNCPIDIAHEPIDPNGWRNA